MTILIDADGCPVVDIVIKTAADQKIDCVIRGMTYTADNIDALLLAWHKRTP